MTEKRTIRGHRYFSKSCPLGETGAVSIPLFLALLCTCGAGFGTWSIMRHWRFMAETQLRLDHCVGEAALELKHRLIRIDSTNGAIRALRTAAAAALATGAGAAALTSIRTALQFAVAKQDVERGLWSAKQVHWIAARGCEQLGDLLPLPPMLPSMHWSRLPADVLGPQPLEWNPGASRRLEVRLRHSPRSAGAVVEAQGAEQRSPLENFLKKGLKGENTWKAKWMDTRLGAISR